MRVTASPSVFALGYASFGYDFDVTTRSASRSNSGKFSLNRSASTKILTPPSRRASRAYTNAASARRPSKYATAGLFTFENAASRRSGVTSVAIKPPSPGVCTHVRVMSPSFSPLAAIIMYVNGVRVPRTSVRDASTASFARLSSTAAPFASSPTALTSAQ